MTYSHDEVVAAFLASLSRTDISVYRTALSQFVHAKLREVGIRKGFADSILLVLHHRGIPVPDDIRNHVATCSDLDELTRWLGRAIDADSIDGLFL